MPRKGEVRKREILPDPKYGDKVVAKFVNTIMNQGKKSVAESILYHSLDIITAKTKEDSLGIFKRAIENTRPTVEVRSRRRRDVSGARRSTTPAALIAEHALADRCGTGPRGEVDGRKIGGGIDRRRQQSRHRD